MNHLTPRLYPQLVTRSDAAPRAPTAEAKWQSFVAADDARLAAIERLRVVAHEALEAVRAAQIQAVTTAQSARALWPGKPSDIPAEYDSDSVPETSSFALYVALTAQALARARKLSAVLSEINIKEGSINFAPGTRSPMV